MDPSQPHSELHKLANDSLQLWALPPDMTAQLINVAENYTYQVKNADQSCKFILRLHREHYHTRRAIECELAWSSALAEEGVVRTAKAIPGRDGNRIQATSVPEAGNPRYLVMFEFLNGDHPDEEQDLTVPFEELGEIAARTHLHSERWQKPRPFERLTWDLDGILGASPTWGRWEDAPNVTTEIAGILSRLQDTLIARISSYGKERGRYGIIHADMRLANLLINGDVTQLIDFDDCGFGWYMYDFAAGISFIEDSPQVPELKAAWVRGYRKFRALDRADEREVDSFVMLRRLALLAWIGSHIDAPEPAMLAPGFARVTAKLAENYLTAYGGKT